MAASRRARQSFRSQARRSPQLRRGLRRLARRLRALRRERGLTQEEAAHRAGVDAKHFQEIEAGRINVTMATLLGIAGAFGMSLSELLQGV
jgi:transcriptional regulator with XRE-family HTH domain